MQWYIKHDIIENRKFCRFFFHLFLKQVGYASQYHLITLEIWTFFSKSDIDFDIHVLPFDVFLNFRHLKYKTGWNTSLISEQM